VCPPGVPLSGLGSSQGLDSRDIS
jgi:hypothetical protein